MRSGGAFNLALVEERPGIAILRATGKQAREVFQHEAGGHRHQRIPPTEKRGRVHTSTVTVAVLAEVSPAEVRLDERDLEMKSCRGSGAGGQHRNVTDSAVQVKHLPSGLIVRCEAERSQKQNRETALAILRARLQAAQEEAACAGRNQRRREQLGCGARGDKVRTYRWQDGVVTDHRTGQKATWERVRRGHLEDLR